MNTWGTPRKSESLIKMVKVFTLDTIFGSRQRMLEGSLGLQRWGRQMTRKWRSKLLVKWVFIGPDRDKGNPRGTVLQTLVGSTMSPQLALTCLSDNDSTFLGQVLLYILQAPGEGERFLLSLLGLENYQPKWILRPRDLHFGVARFLYEIPLHLRKTNFVHFAICPSITLLQTICVFFTFPSNRL